MEKIICDGCEREVNESEIVQVWYEPKQLEGSGVMLDICNKCLEGESE
ncbi:hypothetical protein [Paenibacillus cremeus]|nr:hypothetical protein [Paenibacillus cremeus]